MGGAAMFAFPVMLVAFSILSEVGSFEDVRIRQQQQLAHPGAQSAQSVISTTPDGHIRCGTVIPNIDKDKDRRKLAQKTDCSMDVTNPLQEYSPASGPIYRINTVVHVITDGANGAISQACINSGMAWLNRDFRATAGSKAANSVDTRIEFVLVDTKYHDNADWLNQDHDTEGGFWTAADTDRYMNIFIKTPPGGILGQANLAQYAGWGGADGITVGTSVWGDCATSTMYHQGATATHEVGHYLGLLHTFNQGQCIAGDINQGSPPGCNVMGDLICDTEPEASPVYDCDSRGTCDQRDPIHNFMDCPCMTSNHSVASCISDL